MLCVIATITLIGLSGCGDSHATANSGDQVLKQSAPSNSASSAQGQPYSLYTHCGIKWAKIRGTFWQAEHEMSDGSGNPPEGWGNPFQTGRLTFQSDRIATFTSTAGQVTFRRTPKSKPPFLCY